MSSIPDNSTRDTGSTSAQAEPVKMQEEQTGAETARDEARTEQAGTSGTVSGQEKRKTVMILANSSGGLYDFRNELVLELLDRCNVVASLPDTVKTDLLSLEGVLVEHTPINRRGVNPVQDLELIRAYEKLMDRYHPDIVLTYTIKPNCYGGYVCGRKGIPYLSTVTGLGSTFQKTGPLLSIVEKLYRDGLKKASCVFFQNEENRLIFRRLGLLSTRDRLVMGSGVNTDVWQAMPYPEGEVTNFLFVGRVMKEKGIEEFFRAAEVLHSANITFSICGYCDEDYQEELDARTKKGEIIQLGFHPDMHEFYENCSAVVMPTYHEGMSNVLMEASSCARPVIATNISGCREIFEDGVTGIGFAPKSADALIEALRKFLALNRTERVSMGAAARQKMIAEFDRHMVVAAYMEEIQKVLS